MADEETKSSENTRLASDAAVSSETPDKTAGSIENGSKVEDEDVDGDDEDGEDEPAGGGQTPTDADGTAAPKKKRKPKKKKKKATNDGVVASSTASSMMQRPMPVTDIPSLLKQLSLSQQASKKEGKAPEDYKFWNTQPVPKFKEPNLLQTTSGSNGATLPEGPILPDEVCQASVKPDPEKLLDNFEWCLLDLNAPAELNELYELLYNHYVEDADGAFRFNYSPAFLSWVLKPPGWRKEWHIGVRTKTADDGTPGKLVAFIAGVPVSLKVRTHTLKASEINFLAIHRKLRGKRLAPVLIKEVTRKCYDQGIYQALYTAGTLLPTPIATCRYFHRSLDWEHLYKTGFSHLPPGTTELRMKYKYKVEAHTHIKGLRLMKVGDIPAVRELLARYLERFALRQVLSEDEIKHWLCSETSKGVVWAYVVENDGKVTDFISYYLLESTVLRSAGQKESIRAAYLYHYATSAAFPVPGLPLPKASQLQLTLKTRLQELVHDALVLAARDGFHVFNALTLLDNPLFLKDEKFERGDGKLNYYLFNWRTGLVPGGIDDKGDVDASKMGGVGVLML